MNLRNMFFTVELCYFYIQSPISIHFYLYIEVVTGSDLFLLNQISAYGNIQI